LVLAATPGPGHDRPDQEEAEMDSQAAARRWAATWTAAWQAHDVEADEVLIPTRSVIFDRTVGSQHRETPWRTAGDRAMSS